MSTRGWGGAGWAATALMLALVASGTVGCRRRPVASATDAAAPAEHPAVTVPAARDAGARARDPRPPLIVGSEKGLVEIGLDGAVVRRIARGPARHPRFLDADHVAVLEGDGGASSRQPISVRVVSLCTGDSRVVGQFPAFRCGAADGGAPDAADAGAARRDDELSLQSEDELSVAADGRSLCLTRMDRNRNMADLALSQRLELDTGKVQAALTMKQDWCDAAPGVEVTETSPCDDPRPGPDDRGPDGNGGGARAGGSFPYALDGDKLTRAGDGGRQVVATLRAFDGVEARSPSGRWQVLSGAQESEDYVHRTVVLVDLAEGRVFPIAKRPGPWPAPLDLTRWKARSVTRASATLVGEDDLFWLEAGGDDALVAGNLLIVPERPSVRLRGELAR